MKPSKTPQTPKNQNSKEEIYWAVLESVIRLDIIRGHMNWKITELARASKVSRPLIYYYFGKSKENIMKTAIDFLGQEYFGLSEERMKLWQSGEILQSVLLTRLLCQKAPHIHLFYMFRRNLQTPVGESLREFESRHRTKIQDYYPKLSQDSVEALSAVFFGLVAMPALSQKGVENALKMITENLSR